MDRSITSLRRLLVLFVAGVATPVGPRGAAGASEAPAGDPAFCLRLPGVADAGFAIAPPADVVDAGFYRRHPAVCGELAVAAREAATPVGRRHRLDRR
jgi:hypothetical protein